MVPSTVLSAAGESRGTTTREPWLCGPVAVGVQLRERGSNNYNILKLYKVTNFINSTFHFIPSYHIISTLVHTCSVEWLGCRNATPPCCSMSGTCTGLLLSTAWKLTWHTQVGDRERKKQTDKESLSQCCVHCGRECTDPCCSIIISIYLLICVAQSLANDFRLSRCFVTELIVFQ